jgi:hypothetical protein
VAIACLLCFLSFYTTARADEEERQYKIEAAYLYNFFNYITWPGHASPQALQQSIICVYGEDPVEPYLKYIQNKKLEERRISVRQLSEKESSEGCNIIFLRAHFSNEEIKKLSTPGSLIVSESKDSLDKGSMIELSKEDERIKMKINQSLIEKNNFHISSRLLSLAEEVRK